MVINLNRFKEFNAMHGHIRGDELLIEVSELIDRELDHLDVACRVGGKWHVLLVGEDRESAGKIAEGIISSFEKIPPTRSAITNLSISLSMYNPGEGEKALIERVDDALLEARRVGGNTCRIV